MICRYCGRALQSPTSAELAGESQPATPARKSVWKSASIGAVGVTVLAAYGIVARNPAELIGNLLMGLPITYLSSWIILAGCVWLWRKVGAGTFMFLALMGIFLTGFILLMVKEANILPPLPPTATHAPAPTLKPIPTGTEIAQP